MRLENWLITRDRDNPYRSVARGQIYGHPTKPDGKWVETSLIESISISRRHLSTQNSHYTLGTMSADWCKWLEDNGFRASDFEEAINENRRLRHGQEEETKAPKA